MTEQSDRQVPGSTQQRVTRRDFLQKAAGVSLGIGLGAAGLSTLVGCGAGKGTAPAVITKKSIRYWSFLNPKDNNPRSQAQNQLLADFTKKTGIAVEVEVVPWQEIEQKLIQAAQAGKAPDISKTRTEILPEVLGSGSILPLDEFASAMTPQQKDDFIFPWESTVYNGKKVSFFAEHRAQLLFYRKDLFEQAKLKLPETWDEFGLTARALTKDPLWGTVIPLSKKGSASGLYQWMMPNIWAGGGEMFDADFHAAFNGAPGVAVFQLLVDLVQKYKGMPAGAVSQDVEAATQGLMAGNVAMTVIGSHRISFVRTAEVMKTNLGLARLPGPKGIAPTHESGWHLIMSKDTKNKEQAWKFIEYMVSPEAQLLNVKVAGELPTRKSVLSDAWFKTPAGADAAFALQYLMEKPKPARYPRRFAEVAEALADAAQAVVQGQKQPKAALDEVAQKWEKEIRKL